MLAAWSSDACSCARACPTKQCTTSLGPGYTANSDGSNNRCWHLCTRKPFGSTMQECAVSFFVEQHAQVSLVTLVMPDGPATEPRLAFREERLQGQRTLFCRPKLPAPEVRKALDYRGREARERCRESQAREARRQGRARRPRWTSAAALAARTNSTFVRAARAATGVRRVDASRGGHLMASARAAAGVGALGCAINDLACRRTAAGAAASTEARGSQALSETCKGGVGRWADQKSKRRLAAVPRYNGLREHGIARTSSASDVTFPAPAQRTSAELASRKPGRHARQLRRARARG